MNGAAGQSTELKDRDEYVVLERVANGDREAMSELYRIYQPRLFKFVFRLTQSYTVSDELVNDIMLIVWRKAASFRRASKVSTWIFGIAYRQSLQRIGKKKLRIVPGAEPDDMFVEAVGNVEDEDWVQHGLRALSPPQRLAMVLVFYLGLSYDEVADVSGCPVNTVKTRMYHARQKLKKTLNASRSVSSSNEASYE